MPKIIQQSVFEAVDAVKEIHTGRRVVKIYGSGDGDS